MLCAGRVNSKTMLTVQTRQNSKGNWWCNTTHAGYDIYEEGETIAEAQRLMSETLERRGQIGEVNWETPKPYPKKEPVPKPEIGYAAWRIDKDCIG